jgi:hypothetical protein
LDIERNVLTVRAERRPADHGEGVEMQVSERPLGVFSRHLFLGDTLDTDHVEASYDAGAQRPLRIHYPPGQPVADHFDVLLADLACLQPDRPQRFADARAERSWNAAPHEGLACSRQW